jgi:hypothetical protein
MRKNENKELYSALSSTTRRETLPAQHYPHCLKLSVVTLSES